MSIMSIDHLILFNLALCAAILSPGPALVMAIRMTLVGGRRAGIAFGVGSGCVAALWTLSALLGLQAVFDLFPWAYWITKTAGALYLMWIAVQMWRGARTPIAARSAPDASAFRTGVLVNLLNPKAVLFAAAVLVVIFPQGMSLQDKALIVANHLVIELAFYTALACLLSTEAARRRYMAAKVWLDRGAAIAMGALGLRLVFAR